MLVDICLIAGAYLFGSLPVLYLMGRRKGFDLRQEYDMHLSLWGKVGPLEGVAGVLWDISKGAVPPLIARGLDLGSVTIGLSGLAVVLGQMYPLFFGFKHGEKGNTTGVGTSFGIAPIAMSFAAIPIATGAFMRVLPKLRKSSKDAGEGLQFAGVSDSMPLGMLTGFAVLPMAAWLLDKDSAIVWTFVALFILIVFRRLTAGLNAELKTGLKTDIASVLWNRFLYDRSYYKE